MVRPLLYMRIMIPPFLAVHLQINSMFQDGRVVQQEQVSKCTGGPVESVQTSVV